MLVVIIRQILQSLNDELKSISMAEIDVENE